jgi:hypothetical protein
MIVVVESVFGVAASTMDMLKAFLLHSRSVDEYG